MNCIVPVEKFRDYIFKPGATHGKDHVFLSLGYDRKDSLALAALYQQQAAAKYAQGDYVLSKQDQHGQRITIAIELLGIGVAAGGVSRILTGWMLEANGEIRLLTPFTGFAR